MRIIAGIDAEIALARGFSVVPMFRYNRTGDPGPTRMFGVGGHWRF